MCLCLVRANRLAYLYNWSRDLVVKDKGTSSIHTDLEGSLKQRTLSKYFKTLTYS